MTRNLPHGQLGFQEALSLLRLLGLGKLVLHSSEPDHRLDALHVEGSPKPSWHPETLQCKYIRTVYSPTYEPTKQLSQTQV